MLSSSESFLKGKYKSFEKGTQSCRGGIKLPREISTGTLCSWNLISPHLINGEKQNPKKLSGGVAQLGEHLPCKQGVMGSNPIISTKVIGKEIACYEQIGFEGESVQSELPVDVRDRGRPSAQFARDRIPSSPPGERCSQWKIENGKWKMKLDRYI